MSRLLESQQSNLLMTKARRKCRGTNSCTTSDKFGGDGQRGDSVSPPVCHSAPTWERAGPRCRAAGVSCHSGTSLPAGSPGVGWSDLLPAIISGLHLLWVNTLRSRCLPKPVRMKQHPLHHAEWTMCHRSVRPLATWEMPTKRDVRPALSAPGWKLPAQEENHKNQGGRHKHSSYLVWFNSVEVTLLVSTSLRSPGVLLNPLTIKHQLCI